MDLRLLSYEQFELLCARLLQAEGMRLLQQSGRSHDIGIDFVVSAPGQAQWVVEAKHYRRPSPLSALRDASSQLERARKFLGADGALLIVSSTLTHRTKDSLLFEKKLHLWDETVLQQLLEKHPDVRDEFENLLEAQAVIQRKLVEPELKDPRAEELLERLENLETGKDNWKDYEDLCIEILNYAFIPPLKVPDIQSHSEDGLDRRDAVYPIGYGHIFWGSLRREVQTRFVVAEFKNHEKAPTQREVESIQQYLFPKAMRSFGILCGRQPPSDSAIRARRRAWMEFDKLIVLLSDDDLKEIVQMKALEEEPTEVLDTQLNEFFAVLAP